MTTTTLHLHTAYVNMGSYWEPLHIKVKDDQKRLSFTGEYDGGGGQIEMGFKHRNPAHDDKRYTHPIGPERLKFGPGWNEELWYGLLEAWHLWHLNDMRAGCVHQRASWVLDQELTTTELSWGDEYHKLRRQAEAGIMTQEAYASWPAIVALVKQATRYGGPKHSDLWDRDVQGAIAAGYLKLGKVEVKLSGWVHPGEHPEGLLCKPCPECGYKYGSAWLFEPVPDEVITFLNSLPTGQLPSIVRRVSRAEFGLPIG